MKGAIRFAGVRKVFRWRGPRQRAETLKGALFRRGRRLPAREHVALDGVDFEVAPGEAVAIIGANGSGKSTCLKLAGGILRPTAGTVAVEGRVTALIELGAGFHPEITGRENVLINGMLLGLTRAEVAARMPEIVRFAELGDFIDQPVKTYSSGMYVRLAFAIAIHVSPDILIVDEALAVGDAFFQTKCMQRMKRMLDDGVLLDLGVSSPQIDSAERGFSWRADAPLDMRMDTSRGITAADWLASAPVAELTRVIREFGEERFAAAIAKAVVARRDAGQPVATTAELASLVAGAIPVRSRGDATQHPATRTFQAVRIHVNQELEELALVLEQAVAMLAPGGRLVVISFHSLEDRLVKRFFDRHAHPERQVGRLPLRAAELPQPRLSLVARVRPDAAEVAANPRARSAVMRIAERTATPIEPEKSS